MRRSAALLLASAIVLAASHTAAAQPIPHVATAITATPAKLSTVTTATFRFTLPAKSKATCKLDAGAFAACKNPRTYAALKQGAHTFSLRVTTGKTHKTLTYAWTVDSLGPTAPVLTANQAWRNASSGSVTASGSRDAVSGFASYQHQISSNNGASWSIMLGGTSQVVVPEGATIVRFRALDKLGNPSAWVQATIRLDRHGPSAPTAGVSTAAWTSGPVDIHHNANAADSLSGVAGYQVQTSANHGDSWSSPQPVTGNGVTDSADGELLARFRAVDVAGNTGAWSNAVLARIDLTGPTIAGLVPGITQALIDQGDWLLDPDVCVDADAGAGSAVASVAFEVSADAGSNWSPMTATGAACAHLGTEGDGLQVRAHATDAVGNTGPWFTVAARNDHTAPGQPVVTGGGGGCQALASHPSLTGSGGGDALSGVVDWENRISTNGGATWSQIDDGDVVTPDSAGTYTVQMRTVDAAGNIGQWSAVTAASTLCIS